MKAAKIFDGNSESNFNGKTIGRFESKEMSARSPVCDNFFTEPIDPRHEARALASEVIRRLLIWMADGRTLEERGLRTSVALYCIRPDLIDGTTLEQIGTLAGCSRQAVHKLAGSFKETTGLKS